MQRIKWFTLNIVTYQLLNKFREGLRGNMEKKKIATILHLLQQGQPMLEFEALKPLFYFLNVPMMPRNHRNDSIGWVMVKCMHQHVIKKVKKVIVGLKYLVLSCDKVTIIGNQS